jgi:hypothetical protein
MRGPATVQTVAADEILVRISREDLPDYILVRFHGQVRAFAKFHAYDACVALQKMLPARFSQ